MPKQRSDESLLEIIRNFYGNTGRCPRPKDVTNKDYQMMRNRYGSFRGACDVALNAESQIIVSDNLEEKERLRQELQEFVKTRDRLPTYKDFSLGELSPIYDYLHAFKCNTWPGLLEYLGFEQVSTKISTLKKRRRNTKPFGIRRTVMEAMRKLGKNEETLAELLNLKPQALEEFFAGKDSITITEMEQIFNVLNIKCVPRPSKFTNEMLLDEIRAFYNASGKIPQAKDLKHYIEVIKRFGSLYEAVFQAGVSSAMNN